MSCPYFEDQRISLCRAVRGPLTPSLHERELYCRSDENKRCPTFRLRREQHEALPQDAYYALWLPMVDDDVAPAPRVPHEHARPS